MESILAKVNSPKDIKELNICEKKKLAEEIRKLILNVVSKNGGHLASNLGVVELSIALHTVFNMPKDKIIWDVGHQCYAHKILTRRKEEFETLRKFNGLTGFPKTSESEYDSFDTGHSSTSISVAAGMARARTLLGEDYQVIAVIGDGSLTGGMALEALNDVGSSKTNVTVILNDNEMSISKNVGGVALLLSKIRTKKAYKTSNNNIKRFTSKIPYIGNGIIKVAQKTKKMIMQLILPNMFFEDIGFTYLGPVDGHNIEQLEDVLRRSKEIEGPVLIHVITKKGKGYKFAEENPDKFHGISSFNLKTGEMLNVKKEDYSQIFGNKLVEIAKKDERIVAVTAAMRDGTGLKKFAEEFPNRFFDVGIAEQHALGMIAGMAKAGMKPVFAVYSSFLQRGYDQLIHDIALQKLPVVICIDRAGVVGADGETHQGIFDLSFLSTIPNMTILAPKNFKELEKMLEFSIDFNGPITIRYPRGEEAKIQFEKCDKIELGKAEVIKEGKDLTIIGIGKMVSRAMEIAFEIEKEKISTEVINARFLKPLDEETILESIEKTRNVVTIEDGLLKSGLGSAIIEMLSKKNIQNVNIKMFGYNDCFVKQGKIEELEKKYGIDYKKIYMDIKNKEK